MNNMLKFGAILFALVMASCQKDGSEPKNPTPSLDAPVLKTPASGATEISLTPTFVWESSDEDAVYDLSVSDDNGETWNIVADELPVTTYKFQEDQQLDYETTYDWKVTASLDGESKTSLVFSFTTVAEGEEPALSAPVLSIPASGATDISLTPTFEWETSGDGVIYDLSLSSDNGATWTVMAEGLTATSYTLTEQQKLGYATTYKWKVTAKLDNETEESTVFSFTTVAAPGMQYADGDIHLYLDSQKTHPLNIIITGEGFIQEDYDSGFFDEKVDALMDAFFKLEPYKAYKEYFKIHKFIAVSNQRGASVLGYRPEAPPARPALQEQTVDTRFGLVLNAGNSTSISLTGRWGIVPVIGFYDYMKECFDGIIDDAAFENTIVFILVNINAYAGTTSQNPTNGQSIVMTALPATEPSYIGIMLHESGHGIGKLADEYFSGTATIPQNEIDRILNARKNDDPWTFSANIDFSGNRNEAIWAKYYGMEGYEDVDYVEGANNYGRGVWRPTGDERSLMKTDYRTLWFNTVCREATVRRILDVAGETFDWEEFLRKDVNTIPASMALPYQASIIPLAGPVVTE